MRMISLLMLAALCAPWGGLQAQPAVPDTAFSPMRAAAETAAEQPAWERFTASPKGAFITSALVPGAGELLNGDSDGYYFLGIEALLWGGFIALTVLRNNTVDDYQDWAAAEWDRDKYFEYVADNPDSYFVSAGPLPAVGSDDYYDFIARPQAAPGWRDYEEDYTEWRPESENFQTPKQKKMLGMVDDAETLRRYRTLNAGVIFANHLISAVDAYRTARSRGQGRVSVHMDVRNLSGEAVPHAVLTYAF